MTGLLRLSKAVDLFTLSVIPSQTDLALAGSKKKHSAQTPKSSLCLHKFTKFLQFLY